MQRNPEVSKYMDKIEASESWRDASYRDLWIRCYKRWRNHVDPIDKDGNPIKGRSNISIPWTFIQVETVLPRLVESIFAARPYVTVKGREQYDEANAKSMETLLDWQMCERMDMQDLFRTGLKQLCIYGTTVGYVGWKFQEETVVKKMETQMYLKDSDEEVILDQELNPIPLTDNMTGEPIMSWKEQEIDEVTYDDPEVKFIDLGLFYVDPNATDIEDARYCGHVAFMTKKELEQMAENDPDIELEWKDIPGESVKNDARQRRMSSVGISADDDENQHNDKNKLYEVHFHWEDDKQVIIINRGYVAKDDDNPFWHKKKPYVKDVYTDVPFEFYGMGIVEMLEDLQDELNVERNMRIDYRAMTMRRMWKIRRGANINPSQLTWRQNGLVYVDEMDDLESLEAPDSALSGSFNQEGTIKDDMQHTSGAFDVIMGASGGNETATTTVTKDNNASMRFKLIISSIEKRLLTGISRFMIQLNQQFIDTDRVLRVTGEAGDEWTMISPEHIQGEFDLIAAGSSVEPMANREAFKQRMVELYSVVASDPFMMQFPDKRRNLLKRVYEAFDIQNVDDLLPTDDELIGVIAPPMPPMNPPGGGTTIMEEQGAPLRAIGGGLG